MFNKQQIKQLAKKCADDIARRTAKREIVEEINLK